MNGLRTLSDRLQQGGKRRIPSKSAPHWNRVQPTGRVLEQGVRSPVIDKRKDVTRAMRPCGIADLLLTEDASSWVKNSTDALMCRQRKPQSCRRGTQVG